MSYKVSVIIPTFNRAHTLTRAIESVLFQTFKEFELIIVDDGSQDETQFILEQYSGKIRVLSQENQGVSVARNFAVANAKGKYLAFLDSDDSWHPDKLTQQLEFLSQYPYNRSVHCDEIWYRHGVRVNQMKKHAKGGGDQFFSSLKLCCISPSAILMEKTLFEELGGFRSDFEVCEDYDLWLKLTAQYEVGFINRPLVNKYGGHADQLSRKYFAMDYWRVKSIDSLLETSTLCEEQKYAAIKELMKKSKILLKGYIKHQNLENYQEIKNIQSKWQLDYL